MSKAGKCAVAKYRSSWLVEVVLQCRSHHNFASSWQSTCFSIVGYNQTSQQNIQTNIDNSEIESTHA